MKIGMALGIGMSGFILDWTWFDAALKGDQPDGTLDRIRFLFAVIPITGLVLAFVSLRLFGLTQSRMQEIRARLEERRGTV